MNPHCRTGSRHPSVVLALIVLFLLWGGDRDALRANRQPSSKHITPKEIAVGAKITVRWRTIPSESTPFAAGAPYSHEGGVTAIKAPYPGGGVTGKQLVESVRPSVPEGKMRRVWARGVREGEAADSGPSGISVLAFGISVGDDEREFYDNFVMQDAAGKLVIYLDVEVEQP